MKKLILGLVLLVGTASFANTKNVQATKKTFLVTDCYRAAVDNFGNKYYVKVTCPKTVILQQP